MEKDLKLYLTIINFFENKFLKDLEETEEIEEVISNAISFLNHYLDSRISDDYINEIGIDVIDLSKNKREEYNNILKQEFLVV